jgi:hypothetical protein
MRTDTPKLRLLIYYFSKKEPLNKPPTCATASSASLRWLRKATHAGELPDIMHTLAALYGLDTLDSITD